MPTNEQWAYLAGLIDGDGCITIAIECGRYAKLRIIITQKNVQLLERVKEITGVGCINKVRQRQVFQLQISQNQAGRTLQHILPFLILKKVEAQIGLEFIRYMQSKADNNQMTHKDIRLRHEYAQLMKDAKQSRLSSQMPVE